MRAKAAAALIAGAAIAALLILRGGDERFSYEGPDAPAFSFSYEDLDRAQPDRGELVALRKPVSGALEMQVTAEPLEFKPSAEPVGGSLPLAADRFQRRAERGLPGFALLEEGRTRLEITRGIEAYQLGFTAKAPPGAGGILIGKTYLIPPEEEGADRGVALTILERTDEKKILDAVREQPAGFFLNWPIRFWLQQATAVETPTALQKPVESFAFG
jgi:hypothetical protein